MSYCYWLNIDFIYLTNEWGTWVLRHGLLIKQTLWKHFQELSLGSQWPIFWKKKKKKTRIYVDNEIVFWIIKYLKPIKITLFLSEKWWWAQILNALTKSLIFTSFLSIDYVRNCIIGKGADYKGTISITKSGIQCQAWNSMIPHEHR